MPSPIQVTPRVRARLRSPEALQDAMRFSRLNIRELSEACGNMRYRSTIGHLHSGARTECSPSLAGRIERVLRLPQHSLFDLRVVSTHNMDTGQMKGRNAA
jgi:hypothetical protein